MQITLIADAIYPYSEKTDLSEEAAALGRAFKQAGHTVSLITPFPKNIDVNAHSLARRLTPVKVDVDGRTVSCVRYDSRSPDGVDLFFLDTGEEDGERVFPLAARGLLESLADVPDACIAVGPRAHAVTRTCKAATSPIKDVAQIARLSGGTVDEQGARDAADAADRLAFCSHRLLNEWRGRLESVERCVTEGTAVIIRRPAAAGTRALDKASRKTQFQVENGLPVRDDIPLLLAPNLSEGALREVISQDVQIAVVDGTGRFAGLRQKYADRLVLITEDKVNAALAGADAVLAGGDLSWFQDALANGALPIVDENMARDVVDLEPSLETGSAIVAGLDGPRFKAGLGRLLGGFKQRSAFNKLAARLPSFADTRGKTISQYIQLIDELKSEK